jgi:hypothetical protein
MNPLDEEQVGLTRLHLKDIAAKFRQGEFPDRPISMASRCRSWLGCGGHNPEIGKSSVSI